MIALLLVASVVTSIWLSYRAVSQSQRQWCSTLTLLTSSGPPRHGTPNYHRSMTFYLHLKELEHRFGC